MVNIFLQHAISAVRWQLSMLRLIGTISADSYPVGLDVSKDGRYVLTTSQGREGRGGNSVNIFEIKYL